MRDTLGLSKALHALGHRVKVRPAEENVTLSVDDFDLMWRATIQLGEYFVAETHVEYGVISFDLQNRVVERMKAARAAIDADVLELVGWTPE